MIESAPSEADEPRPSARAVASPSTPSEQSAATAQSAAYEPARTRDPNSPGDAPLPRQVDRFTILRKLGAGGMAREAAERYESAGTGYTRELRNVRAWIASRS